MKELRQAIMTYLKTLHPNVYYEDAPKKGVTPPYLVFSFQPSFTRSESGETMMLDLDGWDMPGNNSSSRIEDLMELIKGDGNRLDTPTGLDRQVLKNSKINATFNFDSRRRIPDENKRVKHILHNYEMTVFERSD